MQWPGRTRQAPSENGELTDEARRERVQQRYKRLLDPSSHAKLGEAYLHTSLRHFDDAVELIESVREHSDQAFDQAVDNFRQSYERTSPIEALSDSSLAEVSEMNQAALDHAQIRALCAAQASRADWEMAIVDRQRGEQKEVLHVRSALWRFTYAEAIAGAMAELTDGLEKLEQSGRGRQEHLAGGDEQRRRMHAAAYALDLQLPPSWPLTELLSLDLAERTAMVADDLAIDHGWITEARARWEAFQRSGLSMLEGLS